MSLTMQKKMVSVRAVVGRIQRALDAQAEAGESVTLKKNRLNVQPELGKWYTVNRFGVLEIDIELAEFASRVGVLKSFEEIEQE